MIIDIKAREIFDSRGNPTIEADVFFEDGAMGRASVPSGASCGKHEAVEKRDGDARLGGKGVLQAVAAINGPICDALLGQDGTRQREVDTALISLDGTDNKHHLGANAMLAVSLAVARASADAQGLPLFQSLGGTFANTLPMPLMNILNGGVHADNTVDIQEFMIAPFCGSTFKEGFLAGVEVYHALASTLKSKGYSTTIGDEGGFAPQIKGGTIEALDLIMQAIEEAGFTPGDEIAIALDVAASELYRDNRYHVDGASYDIDAMVKYYDKLAINYPIFSIEDAMAEDDFEGWQALTTALGSDLQLIGDDLFVTNTKRLKMGIERGMANSILIKPNQIGTLSETIDTISFAKAAGYSTVISHRSGETEDSFIADLAVAVSAGQIKTGAPARSDRMAKYNQLLRIEESLGSTAGFARFMTT